MTSDKLTQALTEAAEAHHVFEAGLGHPDANWQRWYAEFILSKYGPLQSPAETSTPFNRHRFSRLSARRMLNNHVVRK